MTAPRPTGSTCPTGSDTAPRRGARRALGLALVASASLVAACAEPEPEVAAEPEAVPSEVERDALLDALDQQVAAIEGKMIGLAEAMPEAVYGWRPAEGVRSVSEVFVHVAGDNFFIPALMGVAPPSTTGVTAEYSTLLAYEARTPGRAQIIGELRASFRFFKSALADTRGDLGRMLALGPDSVSMAALRVQAVTHLHEHLGQAIAYARSNDVTPPWSMDTGG